MNRISYTPTYSLSLYIYICVNMCACVYLLCFIQMENIFNSFYLCYSCLVSGRCKSLWFCLCAAFYVCNLRLSFLSHFMVRHLALDKILIWIFLNGTIITTNLNFNFNHYICMPCAFDFSKRLKVLNNFYVLRWHIYGYRYAVFLVINISLACRKYIKNKAIQCKRSFAPLHNFFHRSVNLCNSV